MFHKVLSASFWLVKKLALALLLSVLFVALALWLSQLQFTPSQVFLFVFVYIVIYAGIELRALFLSGKNDSSADDSVSEAEPVPSSST